MNTIDDIQIINLLFERQESGLFENGRKYKKILLFDCKQNSI